MTFALAERLESRSAVGLSPAGADADERRDADRPLVDRARAGDRGGFDALVRCYQRPIYYLAYRYLKNEADAADIAQRTFVRAYKSLARFRGDASFRTWLYRIAINLSLNHIRDHKRVRERPMSTDALATDAVGVADLVRNERAQRLRTAIEALPPKQKLVLELRVYDELTFREVAALADCTENAAKVNFHHAVKRLRALMTRTAPEGGSK